MREPSIEAKQQVLKEFLYHIRKDKRVDAEENKLFKLSFKFMNLSREQVIYIDSQVKDDIGDSTEEGNFEAIKFFKNLKEYHLSLVTDYLPWFVEYSELLEAREDFNEVFEINDSVQDGVEVKSSTTEVVKEERSKASEVHDTLSSVQTEAVEEMPSVTEDERIENSFKRGLVEVEDNNFEAAIKLFQIGVDAGELPSIIEMTKIHEDCSSPVYNPSKAFATYTKLSLDGSAQATRALAIMTMEGRGTSINSPKAVSIFEKAIAQGDSYAKEMLEDLLMTLTPEEIEKSKQF